MDLEDLRRFVEDSGVDIWTLINAALTVALTDYPKEFKERRDQIAAKLYSSAPSRCQNCDADVGRSGALSNPKDRIDSDESPEREDSHDGRMQSSSPGPGFEEDEEDQSFGQEEESDKNNDALVVKDLLRIKECLEDHDQPEEVLLGFLQRLFNMQISVEALKETDIGRQVNALRKHPSNEISRLVKQIIRDWKDLVDEWVNTADGKSPEGGLRRHHVQNSKQKQQGSYDSPSPVRKESSFTGEDLDNEIASKGKAIKQSSVINVSNVKAVSRYGESERPKNQLKKDAVPRRATTQKDMTNVSTSEMLASAKKRLQEKYQEAENAKRQRTVQVMDLQDIPKPRNAYFSHPKGGTHGKHRFGGR